ncbi:hypothetical protein NM688_g1424 [Phlebia brevispora]|uniref:Uncharacterized protein n=1 Tax=Phlebia brevispora TaxID=194682 RepID=A0ACC1TB73_9APHY|nr:hypothetical protein NM688_g1424 [Phlebia brevispora]
MAVHFVQEIDYLDPSKMRAAGLTEDEVRQIGEETRKKIMALPSTTFTTFVVMASPKWTTFPPVPPIFKRFLVPYVFYYANRQFWQFLPKD